MIKYRQKLNHRSARITGFPYHYWGYLSGGFVSPLGLRDTEDMNSERYIVSNKAGDEIYVGDTVEGRITVKDLCKVRGVVVWCPYNGEYQIEQDDPHFPLVSFSIVDVPNLTVVE